MDNQHKKIKGYRELSQEEIDLMNRIKEHGEQTGILLEELHDLRNAAMKHDAYGVPCGRTDRLLHKQVAESHRALKLAKDHLQTGQMWFVRAVALPDSF